MPNNNITDQILGVEFPPPLDTSEIKSLQKALPDYQAVAASFSFLAAIC
jgi:hypothetical protein